MVLNNMKKLIALLLFSSIFTQASAAEWLLTKGKRIEDSQGNRVVLQGVNIGNWLVEEHWMMPFEKSPPKRSSLNPIVDHQSLWNVLETRFGKATMHEMRKKYRESWLQDKDFDRIKALGFNSVRVPFLCDIVDEPEGLFVWLDSVISSCKKRDLYVILDMHGAPGGQSAEQHTGYLGQNRFFSDPSLIQKAAKIWEAIAEHYKDEPTVAGYDLLNEPKGAESNKQLYAASHTLYKAIRSKDSRHLIFIEDGFKGIKFMPNPTEFGWQHVVYSTHMYPHENGFSATIQKAIDKRIAYKVPFYFGEFNVAPHGTLQELKAVIEEMQEAKISFSFWSYKIYRKTKNPTLWAFYQASKHVSRIDPYKDSAKEIFKKVEKLNSDNFTVNKDLASLFAKKP
jgi:hypothetical protein